MEPEPKILQAIFDHSALGIAQISLDGSWLRVNDRYCHMLGYTEAELLTRKIWDVTRPADYDEVSIGRRQLLDGAISSHSVDKRYIRKDGTVFWGRLNRSLVRDHDNVPQYFIAMVEDITERINAERALRDSEQRFTLAQSAAHVGIWEWDLRTNLFTYSEEYARLYGLAPDHSPLTVDELPKHIHPDDRERLQASIQNALERTHAWDTEYRVVWPDGSVHWLHSEGSVFLDASGRPIRSTGVVLNVTERKRIEEALTDQLKFETLLAELSATFIHLPANQVDGQIEQAQQRICEALGLDRSMLGQVSTKPGHLAITHAWKAEGMPDNIQVTPQDFPWGDRMILEGKEICFARIDELPPEAAKDKEGYHRQGPKSGAIFPLMAEERVIGVLAFGMEREEREWPRPLVERLRLVAEVFANALARKRVSEQLQTAYSELRHQKEMLQTIFDHIPMMINFGDGKFGLQMVNRAWEQTLGWTLDEIHRDNVDILVENYPDPQYREQVRGFLMNSNGEWANFKTTVRDGRVIDTSWMMLHLPDGTSMGMGQDITERMRAEEALRENERRLVSIYNTVADVVFHLAVEPGGRFRFLSVNPAFLRITELSLESVVGKTVNEVIPEPYLTMALGKYRQAIEENAIVHWEETSEFPTGPFTGVVSVAPVFDDNGTCTNLVGSVHDITERKRAAADLATSRDEIRAHAARLVTAQEDERRRLSIEVHDQICQDLASIAIELGGCAAKPPRREDVASRLRALQARVVKAATEAGHIAYQLHPSVLDHLGLPSALRELCNQFADRAPTISLEFTSGTLPPSVPREVAACLYRIAQESLQNTARHSRAKHSSVALTWQDGTIVLLITDDGVGFDPQVARANGGLGIIGMEERARSVNGKLTIEAEAGSGTRIAFDVRLLPHAP